MAQKIIGLDIGSASIRVLTLKQGLWGLEGGECRSFEFEPGQSSMEGMRECLGGLVASGLLKGETVIVSIPGDEVMTRIISLPFEDPHKIAQVVPFEMEGFLPMNVEDLVIDHQILEYKEGVSKVLVTAVPKDTVAEYLKLLQEVGVDPKVIEMDCMALYNVARYFSDFSERGSLLLDIGRRKTSLCVVKKGILQMIRTLSFGEDLLQAAVSKKTEMKPLEALEKLREEGVQAEAFDQTGETALSIKRTLDSFAGEIVMTLQSIHQENEVDEISQVFVCGEGSQISGLSEYMAQSLDMRLISIGENGDLESKRGRPLKRKAPILSFLPREEKGLYFPAMGLVLKELLASEGSWINFRRGEFVYGKETRAFRQRLVVLGGLAGIILIVGILDLYLHFHMKDAHYQSLKSDLRHAYVSMFPESKTIVDEVQQTRTALKEMRKKIDKIGTGEITPLKIMAELTSRIPEEAEIEVYDLTIDHSKVRMEAEAATFDSIDGIKKSFLELKEVKSVVVSDARVSAKEDRVKFRVTLDWGEGI